MYRIKQISPLGLFLMKANTRFLSVRPMPRQTEYLVPMITADDFGGSARVTLPGWGRYDFDYGGRFRLWQGMSFLELTREYLNDRGFIDLRKLEKTHLLFARCVDAKVSEKMTQIHQNEQHMYSYPIHVDFSITYIGRKSFSMLREVKTHNEETLISSNIRLVNVEVNSMKPSNFPEWWSEKYKYSTKGGPKPQNVQHFQPPPNTGYLYKMTVCPTDVDYHQHVNNTCYSRFCVNAAMAAAHKGLLGNIEPHMIDGQVTGLTGVFLKESRNGDDLYIKVWHNPKDRVIFAHITNASGEDVYQEAMNL